MPFRIQTDAARRLVVVSPEGQCDLADSLAAIREIDVQVRAAGAAGALLEFRHIEYIPSYGEVTVLAAESGRAIAGIPLAFVVDGTLRKGVARQFATQAEPYGVRANVFSEPSAAVDWLMGLGAPP